jgi:hypothetical protein
MKRTKVGNYYIVRPQAAPFRVTASDHLKDAAEIALGVVVFISLFLGIPFLLWLVARQRSGCETG